VLAPFYRSESTTWSKRGGTTTSIAMDPPEAMARPPEDGAELGLGVGSGPGAVEPVDATVQPPKGTHAQFLQFSDMIQPPPRQTQFSVQLLMSQPLPMQVQLLKKRKKREEGGSE